MAGGNSVLPAGKFAYRAKPRESLAKKPGGEVSDDACEAGLIESRSSNSEEDHHDHLRESY